MKLYAKIQDKEGSYERVVLCEFESEAGDKVFVEDIPIHKEQCFKVVIDEGYCNRAYYYPVNRFTITELEIYK